MAGAAVEPAGARGRNSKPCRRRPAASTNVGGREAARPPDLRHERSWRSLAGPLRPPLFTCGRGSRTRGPARMKGLVIIYALTALGVVGSLRTPIIGLFVYILFAVLRPQFLWGYFGDMTNLSLFVGVAMLVG